MRVIAMSVCLLAPVCLAACASTRTSSDPAHAARIRAEVVGALESYQVAARSTDPDRIAAFYTSTGVLLEPGIAPIRGRDAIRTFIASFPGVRVDVATATPERIEVFGDTALVWGSFFERLAFPGQQLSEQQGQFVVEWVRQLDGKWLIERLYRIPVVTLEMPGGA